MPRKNWRPADRRLRGYDSTFDAEKKRWKPIVDQGGVACRRCGLPILPGAHWDLGHAPGKTAITGPEHRKCNRSAGGKLGAAITNEKRKRKKRRSRQW